jgi:hypothetical protein
MMKNLLYLLISVNLERLLQVIFGTPLPLWGGFFATHDYCCAIFPPKLVLSHKGTIISHYRANYNLLSKKKHACANTDYFFCLKPCTFEKFVVNLPRI